MTWVAGNQWLVCFSDHALSVGTDPLRMSTLAETNGNFQFLTDFTNYFLLADFLGVASITMISEARSPARIRVFRISLIVLSLSPSFP